MPVTPQIASANRQSEQASFSAAFLNAAPIDFDRFAQGDGVNVIVWERDGLGVFPAGENGASDLGELQVDRAGDIHLPYIGNVRAQGLSEAQLRTAILSRMSRLVGAADVVVRATARKGQTVTVQGDLQKPGVYPLGRDMVRLSDLLGQAAPNQANPEQLAISMRRGGATATVRLADIYQNPANDIALRPGDSIVAHNVVEQLTVLGAAGVQGHVKLTKRGYSVFDALGDSRGLNDSLANPRAVYLLRNASDDTRPTVYQFDFTRPEQMALAGNFVVHDKDAILISDAPYAQVQKTLSVFSSTLGSARAAGAL
ncbi:Capsule polysaccharide export protein [Candidatus Burkholderia verschuerenii]|uniref:Capsule polysaccharide export protein n=1 Tax=Candidatus Burkholderia verschuerenii TaxID=242163 RepID=A0A0L0M4C0_9BURK|nr:polysaccharide biosynthesis/export family protein [Candidatus Burkholderia verschuerenii]KND57105.1 Capsule polysaccharide export protein [Candidatus Burkholderia verschuerenii]